MKNLKKILVCIAILSSLTSVFAKSKKTTESKAETKVEKASTTAQWYIYEKNNKNVYNGPFETLEDALTAWRADPNIEQKGKFYIGKEQKLITNNPLVYYKSKIAEMDKANKPADLAEEDEIDMPEESYEIAETETDSYEYEIAETEDNSDYFAFTETENNYVFADYDAEEQDFETEEIADEITTAPDTFKVTIIDEPAKTEAEKIDRYKKTYLSDFIAIPEYKLPEDTETPEYSSVTTVEIDEDLRTDMNRVDSFGRTALMSAIKSGNDWQIRSLLNAGADVNAKDKDGWTALMYAVRYQSNLQIVELILNSNPDIKALNKYGHSALIIASCYNNNPDIIRKMLSYYMPSEKEVQKAFILLLSSQSTSEYTLTAKMNVFLELGLPINSYYNGKTPLMYACKYSSSTKVIKLLLDNNSTVSVRSSEGKTAFQYASENKKLSHDDIYWSLNKR